MCLFLKMGAKKLGQRPHFCGEKMWSGQGLGFLLSHFRLGAAPKKPAMPKTQPSFHPLFACSDKNCTCGKPYSTRPRSLLRHRRQTSISSFVTKNFFEVKNESYFRLLGFCIKPQIQNLR